ncbi:MAG: hypothetical protein P8166_17310 [Candidatus Thiodiazotropha sp.]
MAAPGPGPDRLSRDTGLYPPALYMLLAAMCISLRGWIGYTYLGRMNVAVLALIGGVGLLPIMVTVLILILMESDALYHAAQHKLNKRILEKYPPPDDLVILVDDREVEAAGVSEADLKS